jgi:cupin fold WbuC family metalloprotein
MLPITHEELDDLAARAAQGPRRRLNRNVHGSPEDPVQRLYVAACRDSYFRPHRHPERGEFAMVLRGHFTVLLLDATGLVLDRLELGPGQGTQGFDLEAGVWHAWIAQEDGSLFFEVKAGPYDPAGTAFAPWSPAEGTPEAGAFREKLRHARTGQRVDRGA